MDSMLNEREDELKNLNERVIEAYEDPDVNEWIGSMQGEYGFRSLRGSKFSNRIKNRES